MDPFMAFGSPFVNNFGGGGWRGRRGFKSCPVMMSRCLPDSHSNSTIPTLRKLGGWQWEYGTQTPTCRISQKSVQRRGHRDV